MCRTRGFGALSFTMGTLNDNSTPSACDAVRLDPGTEAALKQIARHAFQRKASIMRRQVQDAIRRDMSA